MKTSQDFQKLSAGVSLVILALGFLLIGLMSLIRATPPGDSVALSAMSCIIGAWASVAVAGVFLFAAFAYWQRNLLSPRYPVGAGSFGVEKPASGPKSQESAAEALAALVWVSQT